MLAITALLTAAALVATADQASKALTGRLLAGGALNARGSLVGLSPGAATVVLVVAFAGAALLVAQDSQPVGAVGAAGLGLALGGAASNLADRLTRGGVVDFIAVGPWPAFNLADAAIVAGVVLTAGSLA